jgi:hypothetical protein
MGDHGEERWYFIRCISLCTRRFATRNGKVPEMHGAHFDPSFWHNSLTAWASVLPMYSSALTPVVVAHPHPGRHARAARATKVIQDKVLLDQIPSLACRL